MNSLSMVKLRFEIEVIEDVVLPGFLGNTIRGSLGTALFDRYCVKSEPDCESCTYRYECAYAVVFKSVNCPEGFSTVPNPYVLEVPMGNRRKYYKADSFCFQMLLFGTATVWTLVIIEAMNRAFQGIFADTEGCLRLRRVLDQYAGQLVFEEGEFTSEPEIKQWCDEYGDRLDDVNEVEIELLSPLRIISQKRVMAKMNFPLFMDSLFSRIAGIIDLYGDSEFVLPYGLLYRKPYVTTKNHLKRITITQEEFSFYGVAGHFFLRGPLEKYLPYIDLGTQLHIGKLTTRGFGQYELKVIE